MPCFNKIRYSKIEVVEPTDWVEVERGPGRSMIELIARPDDFHGRRVRVIGYAVFGFEKSSLYLSKHDYQCSISKNGLWLETTGLTVEIGCNEKYVITEGVFNATLLGHLCMHSGGIEQIARLEQWSPATGM